MRSLLLGGAVLLAAGCTCRALDGGLEVEVKFQGFRPGCLDVTVVDRLDPTKNGTTQVTVTESRPHFIAIAPGKDWSSSWSLTVAAREASCSGKIITSVRDDEVEIPKGKPITKTYTLSATDGDGDGWISMSTGGTDCDDGQAMSSPGLAEACGDGVDNDCSGQTDCIDPACAGQTCSDGNACTSGDVCVAGQCNGSTVQCGAPTQPCRQADAGRCEPAGCFWPLLPPATPCGTGMACNSSGVCVAANTELNCADGLDDDGDDAGIDCGDDDCNQVACDAGRCAMGATCKDHACSGMPVQCASPSLCHDAGVCNPASGACTYPFSPASSSCSTDACSMGQSCDGLGTCGGGGPRTCIGGSGACQVGYCDAGTCLIAASTGSSCNDGMSCTHSDVCTAGACSGTTYNCNAAPQCQMPAVQACQGDAGCTFVTNPALEGTRCDAGFCTDGGCVAPFPYAVSNVDPTLFTPTGAVVIDCGLVLVNTDDGGVSPSWCNGPAPATYPTVQQGSNEPVMVFAMSSLTVTDAGTLYFYGSRSPVVLVYDTGVTLLDGRTSVRGIGFAAAAGGNRASCGTQSGVNGAAGQEGSGAGGGGWLTGGGRGGTGTGPGADGGAGVVNPASFTPLLGGCPGGTGGPGIAGDGGSPGAGGGALQISVAGELRMPAATASITASGGGGGGGVSSARSGGGGGGSGGAILLEARRLNLIAGWVTAPGGGGGEGSDDNEPGTLGEDGYPAAAGTPNGGGNTANNGGNGGDGAGNSTAPQNGANGNTNGGGGAGGGAMGRLFLRAADGGCVRTASFNPPFFNAGGCN